MISFAFTKKDDTYNFYIDKITEGTFETRARTNLSKVELRYAFELALEYLQARLDPWASNEWDETPKPEKRTGFGLSSNYTKIYRTDIFKVPRTELIAEDLSRFSIIDFSIFNYEHFSKEFV